MHCGLHWICVFHSILHLRNTESKEVCFSVRMTTRSHHFIKQPVPVGLPEIKNICSPFADITGTDMPVTIPSDVKPYSEAHLIY